MLGEVKCVLVTARSRIAPIKPQTIPRLELMGALVLAELIDVTKKELSYNFSLIKAWTDSTVTYFWIVNQKNEQVFVKNRVNKILNLLPGSYWSLVGTKSNPADIVSRGMDAQTLTNCDVWFNGPAFLLKSEAEWPSILCEKLPTNDTSTLATLNKSCIRLSNIFNLDRYNCLQKLLRITSYVLRFVSALKKTLVIKAADYTISPQKSDLVIQAADYTVSPQKSDLNAQAADYTVSQKSDLNAQAADYTISPQKSDLVIQAADYTVSPQKSDLVIQAADYTVSPQKSDLNAQAADFTVSPQKSDLVIKAADYTVSPQSSDLNAQAADYTVRPHSTFNMMNSKYDQVPRKKYPLRSKFRNLDQLAS